MAWDRIVVPAPVYPVFAFRPGAKRRSASRMRTRFSIRRARSMRPADATQTGGRMPLARPAVTQEAKVSR
jgi:hypothetical protein